MAVGLSVSKEKLPILQEKFEAIAKQANIEELLPIIKIDSIVNIDHVNQQMVESLSLLEPIGEGNKMPIFAIKNLKIISIRALSEGKHIKLTLKSEKNTYVDAIGFNLGEKTNEFVIGDKIDIAGHLEINLFNGVESIQINLKDIKKSCQ